MPLRQTLFWLIAIPEVGSVRGFKERMPRSWDCHAIHGPYYNRPSQKDVSTEARLELALSRMYALDHKHLDHESRQLFDQDANGHHCLLPHPDRFVLCRIQHYCPSHKQELTLIFLCLLSLLSMLALFNIAPLTTLTWTSQRHSSLLWLARGHSSKLPQRLHEMPHQISSLVAEAEAEAAFLHNQFATDSPRKSNFRMLCRSNPSRARMILQ